MNKKRGQRRNARRNEKEKSDLDLVVDDFVACGRCSFFLAGYRVLHGMEALKEAAEASDDEWLVLRWDMATKQLVQKSYGSRLDIEFYYFDGRCPECQRRFVIEAGEQAVEEEVENGAGMEVDAETATDEVIDIAATTGDDEPSAGEAVAGEDAESWEAPEPSVLRVALTSI